jgi:hypothetical protein
MTPKRLDDMLQMSESEFEELLARAAQEGARVRLSMPGSTAGKPPSISAICARCWKASA